MNIGGHAIIRRSGSRFAARGSRHWDAPQPVDAGRKSRARSGANQAFRTQLTTSPQQQTPSKKRGSGVDRRSFLTVGRPAVDSRGGVSLDFSPRICWASFGAPSATVLHAGGDGARGALVGIGGTDDLRMSSHGLHQPQARHLVGDPLIASESGGGAMASRPWRSTKCGPDRFVAGPTVRTCGKPTT